MCRTSRYGNTNLESLLSQQPWCCHDWVPFIQVNALANKTDSVKQIQYNPPSFRHSPNCEIAGGLVFHRLLMATSICVAAMASGCQTMKSFQSTSIKKVASARTWAKDGFDALRDGQLSRATASFSNAARDLPDDPRLRANLAQAHFNDGNLLAAIATMERAVESSEDPTLRVRLGEMYLADGQWLSANRHADLAIKQNHQLARAWALKGKLAAAKGDRQTALRMLQKSLSLDGRSKKVQMLISQLYLEMNEPMKSLSATETLLSQYAPDQQPETAIIARSQALTAMGQESRAIETLQIAARKPGCGKEIYFQLGKSLLASNNRLAAIDALNRGQTSWPDEPVFAELIASMEPGPTLASPGLTSSMSPFHRVASIPASTPAPVAKAVER